MSVGSIFFRKEKDKLKQKKGSLSEQKNVCKYKAASRLHEYYLKQITKPTLIHPTNLQNPLKKRAS